MSPVTATGAPTPFYPRSVAPWLLGFLLASLVLLLDGRYGTFLADEGYLWYGVQRVLAGEVPLRDFMSYEIGRYYLTAGLLALSGSKGILALRVTLALWMGVGLGLALSLIAREWNVRRWTRLVLPALALGVWMVPRHKIFDITIAIVVVAAIAFFLRAPTTRRSFVLGLTTGLAAVVGQNHGLYAVVACGITFGLVAISQRNSIAWFCVIPACMAGVIVGYVPVIAFASFVPGYLSAQLASLHFILVEYKGTNLPLPIPWPWTPAGASDISAFVIGVFFLLLLLGNACLTLAALVLALRRKILTQPLLIAATAVSIPYMNVAFSRADASHLAQAIAPLLIAILAGTACMAAPRSRHVYEQALAGILVVLGCVAALPIHPRFQAYQSGHWERLRIDGTRLHVDPSTASMFASIKIIQAQSDLKKGSVLALPFYPGLSAAFNQKNPIWEIYALFPRAHAFQQEEIHRLAAQPPALIIVSRAATDGRAELAYPASHPLIYQYIRDHYRLLALPGLSPDLEFYAAGAQASTDVAPR